NTAPTSTRGCSTWPAASYASAAFGPHFETISYYSDQGQPVETADIVVPAALCEIVYEIPISR
ncbi:hypothetical protein ACPCJW_25565, partial [Streptomyces griseoincarnatus]